MHPCADAACPTRPRTRTLSSNWLPAPPSLAPSAAPGRASTVVSSWRSEERGGGGGGGGAFDLLGAAASREELVVDEPQPMMMMTQRCRSGKEKASSPTRRLLIIRGRCTSASKVVPQSQAVVVVARLPSVPPCVHGSALCVRHTHAAKQAKPLMTPHHQASSGVPG